MNISIRPQAFSVISFDLDDCLYDNRPIIAQAEAAMQQFLLQHYPRSTQWQFSDWRQLKMSLLAEQPALKHDTSLARLILLQHGLIALGYSAAEAKKGAKAGLEHFRFYRSNFSVSKEVIVLLTLLKQHYRLIAISNGNVDYQRIGLGDIFEFALSPGNGLKQKPAKDMFVHAAQKLGTPLSSILHVGDSAKSDVDGARKAGCQAVWLNPGFGAKEYAKAHQQLAHITLSDIQLLKCLIN
ncbi:HAD family hydrolase [Shewanella sp. Choline-02u-19]|uniref:HAD-IA family hydrolase n=1 Tax=unclassified Shewanella TaxID=196818 RepID=UPI000C34CAEE|nr:MULTISPECIES: HAD-IA family hydrolase [unclassified Shewanella]PKG75005.1 HAD family hydrolase [Shewanella sp. GutCb]PKH58774.1 HAD family hydrolase [Shewanella sp. Bg11-22]PKI29080.1 HAD family hydrolase [Shewanella sp. Choline-02u-19]